MSGNAEFVGDYNNKSDREKTFYDSMFVKFLGANVDDGTDFSYRFTVPKSSSITREDLEKYWGNEFLEYFGISDDSDWNSPIGIAKLTKYALKKSIILDAKNMAKERFHDDDFANKFAKKVENDAKFMYRERDEEWSAEKGLEVVNKTVERINQLNSYQEI